MEYRYICPYCQHDWTSWHKETECPECKCIFIKDVICGESIDSWRDK